MHRKADFKRLSKIQLLRQKSENTHIASRQHGDVDGDHLFFLTID